MRSGDPGREGKEGGLTNSLCSSVRPEGRESMYESFRGFQPS